MSDSRGSNELPGDDYYATQLAQSCAESYVKTRRIVVKSRQK